MRISFSVESIERERTIKRTLHFSIRTNVRDTVGEIVLEVHQNDSEKERRMSSCGYEGNIVCSKSKYTILITRSKKIPRTGRGKEVEFCWRTCMTIEQGRRVQSSQDANSSFLSLLPSRKASQGANHGGKGLLSKLMGDLRNAGPGVKLMDRATIRLQNGDPRWSNGIQIPPTHSPPPPHLAQMTDVEEFPLRYSL